MNKELQHCMKSRLIETMNLKMRKIQCNLIFILSISFDPFLSFSMSKRLVWIMHIFAQTFRYSSALWRIVYWFIHSFDGWFLFARSLTIRARCRRNQQLPIGPGQPVLDTNLLIFGEVSPDVSLRRYAWCALVVHIAIDCYTQIPWISSLRYLWFKQKRIGVA
jgi:hypothetical protein